MVTKYIGKHIVDSKWVEKRQMVTIFNLTKMVRNNSFPFWLIIKKWSQ